MKYYRGQFLAPYVASSMPVVEKMLEYAELKPGELVYDLGCGDGRIVIMAAQKFGARGVGIELNRLRVKEARAKVESLGLGESVRIIHNDFFKIDLSPADIVTMYLTTNANRKVRPKLERELRPRTRIVTHDFKIPEWKISKDLKIADNHRIHVIYLYDWNPD
jgi:protein-L-isoaspartate O-methyltransferase